jgi:hypothetical protein
LKTNRSQEEEEEKEEESFQIPLSYDKLQKEIEKKLNDSNQIFGYVNGEPFYLNPRRNSRIL